MEAKEENRSTCFKSELGGDTATTGANTGASSALVDRFQLLNASDPFRQTRCSPGLWRELTCLHVYKRIFGWNTL